MAGGEDSDIAALAADVADDDAAEDVADGGESPASPSCLLVRFHRTGREDDEWQRPGALLQ